MVKLRACDEIGKDEQATAQKWTFGPTAGAFLCNEFPTYLNGVHCKV